MDLYFGNVPSTAATVLLIGVLVFIGITAAKQCKIAFWGRRIALLAAWGLLICIVAATRDNYALSAQASMGGSTSPGLFAVDGLQSVACCIGGAVISLGAVSSIFVKKQGYRKAVFFIISAAIVLKTLVIEISRTLI